MHCYLYVTCRNRRCKNQILLNHQQVQNQTVQIEYPDPWFPVTITCPVCKTANSYRESEIKPRASLIRLHNPAWKPILSSPNLRITPVRPIQFWKVPQVRIASWLTPRRLN